MSRGVLVDLLVRVAARIGPQRDLERGLLDRGHLGRLGFALALLARTAAPGVAWGFAGFQTEAKPLKESLG